MSNECPCGSGKRYTDCCAPLHEKRQDAKTAEALMRSRYSAYVLQLTDYLLYSWHPKTRPLEGFDWAPRWQGLEIIQTRLGQTGDKLGYVEFVARFEQGGTDSSLRELSRFQRFEGRWVYLDGDQPSAHQATARNAPCPCGSGKKYKLCCNR